jgi:hypothetical protein
MPFSATTPDGVPISVRGGTRMRGSDEAVQRWPQYFLADGATDGEKAAAYRKLAGDPVIPDPAPAATVLEPMSGDEVVESLEDYSFGGDLVMKGQRLRNSHPLVKQYPDCVRPVA